MKKKQKIIGHKAKVNKALKMAYLLSNALPDQQVMSFGDEVYTIRSFVREIILKSMESDLK